MKVLVSAIACDPFGGSEGGIGWRIAEAISCDHEVFVMTSPRHRDNWEAARLKGLVPDSMKVRFIGNCRPWHRNRFRARIQSWKDYLNFSELQLEEARRWVAEECLDLAHQVTYASWRVPSPLWKLSIPFVWGPVGGAARIPRAFYPMLSLPAMAFEAARELSSRMGVRRRAFLECVEGCDLVLPANHETAEFLAKFRGDKPMQRLWSGYLSDRQLGKLSRPSETPRGKGEILRIFAGGNLEGRKGVLLALRALAVAKTKGVKFHYLLAGGGPEVPKLKAEAERLGLDGSEVEFHPGFQGDAYVRSLQEAEVYLLPSFRETTPVTLLEAMAAGCFPIVANSSAAGEVVTRYGGEAVAAETIGELVDGLADAIVRVWRERPLLESRTKGISENVARAFSKDLFREKLAEAYKKVIQDHEQ